MQDEEGSDKIIGKRKRGTSKKFENEIINNAKEGDNGSKVRSQAAVAAHKQRHLDKQAKLSGERLSNDECLNMIENDCQKTLQNFQNAFNFYKSMKMKPDVLQLYKEFVSKANTLYNEQKKLG